METEEKTQTSATEPSSTQRMDERERRYYAETGEVGEMAVLDAVPEPSV